MKMENPVIADVIAEQDEYRNVGDPSPDTDAKGRIAVECMSEREMLKEILTILRMGSDAAENLADSLNSNPMLKSMGFGI